MAGTANQHRTLAYAVAAMFALVLLPSNVAAQSGGESTLALTSASTVKEQPPASAAPDLNGTWAQIQVQSSLSSIPVVGDVVSDTISILRTQIVQEGETLRFSTTPCAILIESEIGAIRTIVPPAMLRALGTMQLKGTLTRENEQWILKQPPTLNLLGVRLKKPWTDTLPTWSRDSRVKDVDGDGNPGVTIQVRGMVDGEIYLVQRSWTELTGVIGKDRIDGLIRWDTDQSILGASSSLLESGPKTRPNPEKERSFFRMRRISSAMSCDDIVHDRKALLGR